jgi:hypothetical protein
MILSITRVYKTHKHIRLNLKSTMLNQSVLRVWATKAKQSHTKETGLVRQHITVQRTFEEKPNLFSPEAFIFQRLGRLNHGHTVLLVLLRRILQGEVEGPRKTIRTTINDMMAPWQAWRRI